MKTKIFLVGIISIISILPNKSEAHHLSAACERAIALSDMFYDAMNSASTTEDHWHYSNLYVASVHNRNVTCNWGNAPMF